MQAAGHLAGEDLRMTRRVWFDLNPKPYKLLKPEHKYKLLV